MTVRSIVKKEDVMTSILLLEVAHKCNVKIIIVCVGRVKCPLFFVFLFEIINNNSIHTCNFLGLGFVLNNPLNKNEALLLER